MRLWRRVVKVVLWAIFLVVLLTAGAVWFAYAVVTDGETAARLIRAQAARFLPRSVVELGRVNISLIRGEVTINHVFIKQKIDGQPFLAARIPWLSVRMDARELLSGRFDPREVVVSHPTLRLCRRRSGAWSLEGLVATSWPAGVIAQAPPIVINNGTVELLPWDENGTGGAATPKAGARAPEAAAPPAMGAADGGIAILRDVSLRIEPVRDGRFRFEGTARGDLFEKLRLHGFIDPATGDATLEGELAGLTLSENLQRRIPAELRPAYRRLGLTRGEIDLELNRLAIRPAARPDRRIEYDMQVRLEGGVWECPSLPFPISELKAALSIADGRLTIKHASGTNGSTILRGTGSVALSKSGTAPLDLRLDLLQLELDKRIRERTPPQFAELWEVFRPEGILDASLRIVREHESGPIGVGATVICRDVAAVYRHFPYRLEHLGGRLALEGKRLSVDLHGLIGDRPAFLAGTIDNPGPDADVRLKLQAESIPLDEAFRRALPPDARKVVDQFHPIGSVKALVDILRKPMVGPRAKPEGHLQIHAALDLNPRCEITWAGLPYPVRNLTGRLELHPDLWEFKNMRGTNGQAVITGSGRVQKLDGPTLASGEPPMKVDLRIQAENLPFNDDLRKSLQPAWRKTWSIINPIGASDVDALIRVEPGRRDVNHIVITPRPESHVRLEIQRAPVPGVDHGGTLELRMENVQGRFDFDNGRVAMHDVHFLFHGAPVQFESGQVVVADSGQFALSASDLWVKEIRLDSALRKIMPPLMAQFAMRLDDGRPFTARGNLQIGWSGEADEPAWCKWSDTKVVFIDNSLKSAIPLEHIQGQLEQVRGGSNGQSLEVHGVLRLASVSLMGQQISELESPFHVDNGSARLEDIQGKLLGGRLLGNGSISLNDTPKYSTSLRLDGADLEQFARTQPGRQSYRGKLSASIALSGLGGDVRSIQGKGDAHITEGDLGELPPVFRVAKFLNVNLALLRSPRGSGKSAFDLADVEFLIDHGTAILDPIKFTGNAFSLQGKGSRDPLGNLDIQLKVLYGRDRFHLGVVSDLMREASGQIFIVHVQGTSASPSFKPEALPQVQRLGGRRNPRQDD
jgi:hypothetical protein